MLYIEIHRGEKEIGLDVVSEENVRTNAYLLWKNAGKPEGEEEKHYKEALENHKHKLILPDGEYKKLEKILNK